MENIKMLTEEQLKLRDFIILIDKSKSMEEADVKGMRRWDAAMEQVLGWAKDAQKYDADGITVGFFANKFQLYKNTTPEKVAQIFKEHNPGGSTDTHEILEAVLNEYLNGDRKKPILVFVVTDGAATDQNAVAKVIIDATKKMKADEEIGIQFLRIGNDTSAKKFCEWLDDELERKGAKFDIVDTNSFDDAVEMTFEELCSKTLSD